MAKIINIIPVQFLGAVLTNPKVLGSKIAEIITKITERGTVTQLSSITTAVTLNTQAGVITTVALTTAAATDAGTFTVTNDKCFSDSVVNVTVFNAGTGAPLTHLVTVANGSFSVKLRNVHSAAAFNSVLIIHFNII